MSLPLAQHGRDLAEVAECLCIIGLPLQRGAETLGRFRVAVEGGQGKADVVVGDGALRPDAQGCREQVDRLRAAADLRQQVA